MLLREGRFDIVHFAGHGRYDANRPERSCWMFSDGPLYACAPIEQPRRDFRIRELRSGREWRMSGRSGRSRSPTPRSSWWSVVHGMVDVER
jgi:hypothetical protein